MSTCKPAGKTLAGFVSAAVLSVLGSGLQAQDFSALSFHPAPLHLEAATQPLRSSLPANGFLFALNESTTNQAGDKAAQAAALARYRQAISRLDAEEGPFAPALTENLTSLGLLQQSQGDHEGALKSFDRAIAVSRMHEGLAAPAQIALTEHAIASLKALGQLEEVDAKYRFLVHLNRQYYGAANPQTAAALQGLGKWQMESFHRDLLAPVTLDTTGPREYRGLLAETIVDDPKFAELYAAQQTFLDAIRLLIEDKAYANPELYQLERELISTFYINAKREQVLADPRHYALNGDASFGSVKNRETARPNLEDYRNGENAYLRQIGYLKLNPAATMQELASTMLELGDWHLLFGNYGRAEQQYRELESLLVMAKLDEAEIDAIMQPDVPATLPAFLDTAISGDVAADKAEYAGYVDVVLNLNGYGRVGDVDVLGSSEGTSDAVEARLVSLVRNAQFRPAQGQAFNTGVRYYYSY